MRTAPARSGHDSRLHEFRVRFHARLTGARLVPADAALPPAPVPTPAAVPAPTPRPAPPPEPAPTDLWTTDVGRELAADRERIESVLEQVRAGVEEVRASQAARLREWQRAAVELAMTTAARLLHERVVSGEFPMEAKVREMVDQLAEDSPVTVRLNPTDLELLQSRLDREALPAGRDDARYVPDPSLGRGECRVEGRESMLLFDVTRELQEIRDDLLRSLGHARS